MNVLVIWPLSPVSIPFNTRWVFLRWITALQTCKICVPEREKVQAFKCVKIHSTSHFLLWKLTELKKQDGRLQSYESLGLNFHSALTACGFGQVPSPAGLTGLWDLVPEPPYCPPLAGWAQQPCRMEWAGEEYKHICFLDCRFSSLIQKIGSWLDCLQLKTTVCFFPGTCYDCPVYKGVADLWANVE